MFTYNRLPTFPEKKKEVANHRFYFDPVQKVWLPSVTTTLKVLDRKGIEEWEERVGLKKANKIKQEAATRGDVVHNLIEQYLQNKLDKDNLPPNLLTPHRKLFNQLRMQCNAHVNNVILQEDFLFSNEIGVAGKVDLVADYDGECSIIDFKTATNVKKDEYIESYKIQVALYGAMVKEMYDIDIKQGVILISCEKLPVCQTFIVDVEAELPKAKEIVNQYYSKHESFILKVNDGSR